MTPGARIQASIEIIDQILMAWQSPKRIPVDKLLERYFKGHRYIGSKDRGAVSELVYWVLRHKASLVWWADRLNQRLHGRTLIFAALVLRKDYNPDSIKSQKIASIPLLRWMNLKRKWWPNSCAMISPIPICRTMYA